MIGITMFVVSFGWFCVQTVSRDKPPPSRSVALAMLAMLIASVIMAVETR